MKTRILNFAILSIAVGLNVCDRSYAITIKGKLPSGVQTATASAVVSDGETLDRAVDTSSQSSFTLNVDGSDTRLYLVKDNNTLPILVAILVGNKVYSVGKAIAQGKCDDDGAVGLAVFKKNISKNTERAKFKLYQVDGSDAYAALSGIVGVSKAEFPNKIKKYADKTVELAINADCSPTGNASSLGLGASTGGSNIRTLDEEPGDQDSDGMGDEFDVDDDGDGVLDPYDSDNSDPDTAFRVFTNLKVGIENTINKNAIPSLTDEQIDAVVSSTQSMAIEVKVENESGRTAEIDCGSLTYCAASGTGHPSNTPGESFPEDFDEDADGNGKITKGGTGDFQLITGANTTSIGSGDVLIQTVTDDTTSDVESTYLTALNFAFSSTPAFTTMVVNQGDATEATYTPTYPVANNGQGTATSPFSVQPSVGDGHVHLKITAYRPQRKGITGAGEAALVDIGNSSVVIDLPNAPSSGGGATSGPGNCPPSSYSTTDADLSVSGDVLLDAQADFDSSTDTDGDGNKSVTFTVDITDCLTKNGSTTTLDSGESLKVDLQFKNGTGDNAAQAFYISRP